VILYVYSNYDYHENLKQILILFQQIPCVGLGTVGGFSWTLNGSAICVWDGALDKCHLQVYESSTGELIGNYQPPAGGRIFGIKAIAWSPSGQFIALSSFDDKVSCV
jgi:hypothetical protein